MDFLTLWGALAPGDLPGPVPEYRFHPVRRWRFDWAWPARRVACEIDGGQWRAGGGRHNTDPDREKLNTAAALGWRVLRFSHAALTTDPAGCIALTVGALVLGSLGDTSGQDLADFQDPNGILPPGSRAACGRDPGAQVDPGGGDLRGDLAPTPATVKLQRRPGLQLARPHPVKLARRAGDLAGDP